MKENIKIPSSWTLNKQGICVIKKNKKDEWSQRLNALKQQVNYWIDNKTDKSIEIIQLFYDQ
jgi:Holliday junction resolvasome RuvABC endonuclease subunit